MWAPVSAPTAASPSSIRARCTWRTDRAYDRAHRSRSRAVLCLQGQTADGCHERLLGFVGMQDGLHLIPTTSVRVHLDVIRDEGLSLVVSTTP